MSPETILADLIADRLAGQRGSPLVIGLCGAQGSGKSTVAAALSGRFPRSAVLSLDDLYKTRADRQALARDVHPLFATRGVPGTHDVALGLATLDALARGEPAPLPRFDKAIDDRVPPTAWPRAPEECALLILEGWCVGAVAQGESALVDPVNDLERHEDADGRWRRHVDAALAGDYRALFARLDVLALMMPPDWDTVLRWRTEQENALRRTRGEGMGVMDDRQLARFVSHYERLTRHIWDEMPGRADATIRLNVDREVSSYACVGEERVNGR